MRHSVGLTPAGNEVCQRDAQRRCHSVEFDEVKPSLTRLVLCDEGLRFFKSFGHVDLPEALVDPNLAQQLREAEVRRGVNRLVHCW